MIGWGSRSVLNGGWTLFYRSLESWVMIHGRRTIVYINQNDWKVEMIVVVCFFRKGCWMIGKSRQPYKTLISFSSQECTKLLTVPNSMLIFETKYMLIKKITLMSSRKILDIIVVFRRKTKKKKSVFIFHLFAGKGRYPWEKSSNWTTSGPSHGECVESHSPHPSHKCPCFLGFAFHLTMSHMQVNCESIVSTSESFEA